MCHADALSRLPLDHGEGDEVPQPAEVVFLLQKLDYSPATSEHIKTMTRRDPVLSKVSEYVTTGWPTDCANSNLSVYFHKQNEISIENGCLLWGTRVIIPTSGHKAVLELLHECHPGIVKMKSIARRVCWWPTVHPWEWPGIPWHRIHVDYAGPINGKMYLIIIDSFSKWLEIIPTESATAEVTIKALREVMSRWGLPLMLVSDNGPCFTSYKRLAERAGLAERAVQVFKRGVKKLSGIIDDNIAHFLLYYRSTPQNTTGESPSFLMLNRQIRTRVDIMLPQRHNDVIVKQQNMLLGGKRKEPRTLYMGDPVRIVNFSKSAKNQDKWLAGVVSDKLEPLTYLITLDDGRIFRRHIDHIRLSTNSMTNIGTPQPLDVEVPNVLISDTTAVDGREPLFCDDARTVSPERTYSSPQVMSPATVQQSPNRALMPQHSLHRASMPQQSPDRASATLQSTPSAQSQSFDEECSTRDMSIVPVPPIMEATGLRRSTRTTQGQRPARYEQ